MGKLFGKRLRRARLQEGLTQAQVAKKLKISPMHISTWETGRHNPSARYLQKLEDLFGDFNRSARALAEATDEDEEYEEEDADEEYEEDEDEADEEDEEYEEDEDEEEDEEYAEEGEEYEEEEDDDNDDSNAYGEWVRDTRRRAGMSRIQLAESSGVSAMAIRNIEIGKTQNPQDKTRKRLEKALKAKVPKDIAEETAEEQTIRGLGALVNFDPYSRDDLPTVAGVYVLYDISDRPIYIGQGKNISKRVRNHAEKFWFKHPIVSHAAYVEIVDTQLRYQVEQVLIKFLKSNAVINKQSVERKR